MNALSFGEILWDVIEGKEHIGGAPFNLASHLAMMGADSAIISAVGDDKRGKKALEKAVEYGIDTRFINTEKSVNTGIVEVELDKGGSPSYDIKEDSAWDFIELSPEQLQQLSSSKWDVFTFGSLAQRSEQNRLVLEKIIEAAAPTELFFDVNLRLDYYNREIIADSLRNATILKLNDDEVPVVSRLLYGEKVLDRAFCERMEREWGIHTTCITRGEKGSSVFCRGHYSRVPIVPVEVADTVGAGDSFSAAFLYGYFTTGDVKRAINLASLLSSFVASKNGAIPAYDEPVRKAVERISREGSSK
ncbi:MAG: carbohydrate kinase family protein [Spirochaetaceae bacterium]